VIYQDRVIHVGGWAARFLFTAEQLNQKVGRLSGGERARVLIAQLMLQPADVLLLDEPTNDLDIPTLEILEESLLEYTGALVLVTHDRYMLDRVSTVVLGLDGAGGAQRFADYSQWEEWSRERKAASRKQESAAAKSASESGDVSGVTAVAASGRAAAAKKKLSYNENRELETIEQRVAEAEADLQSKHDALLDPAIMSDGVRLHAVSLELEASQKRIDELYVRWVELEDKLK
jgi:ATP-binding cassette subfamily F protein uup